jgi:hypothetical protein
MRCCLALSFSRMRGRFAGCRLGQNGRACDHVCDRDHVNTPYARARAHVFYHCYLRQELYLLNQFLTQCVYFRSPLLFDIHAFCLNSFITMNKFF